MSSSFTLPFDSFSFYQKSQRSKTEVLIIHLRTEEEDAKRNWSSLLASSTFPFQITFCKQKNSRYYTANNGTCIKSHDFASYHNFHCHPPQFHPRPSPHSPPQPRTPRLLLPPTHTTSFSIVMSPTFSINVVPTVQHTSTVPRRWCVYINSGTDFLVVYCT